MSKKILTPVRTLVVDDEDIVLSLVRDALDEEPVAIDTCTTGQEALQKLEERQYELLITDIRMPKVSGIELATKARDKWPGLRVIFMTGFANLGSAKEAIQQGAVDYILKPFDLNELRKSVQKAIQIIVQDRNRVSEDKLSKLSDLGHKLFNAGDYQALGLSSLRFAMMLQQSTSGLIVCRPDADSPFVMLSLNNNYFSKQTIEQIPECQGVQLSDDIEPEFLHPRLVTSLKEHPLFRNANCETCLADAPKWLFDDTAKLVTPVTRADFFYGMIAIRADADTAEFRRSDLELLAIVANQLAGALENLQLLAASKKAYSRLKELQDETIELEKMATRGAMSAEIGHELNNFLSIVSGNLTLIGMNLRKGNYDKLEGLIRKVNDTVERMTRFTSNLMDLGSVSSEKEVLNFVDILTEVVEHLLPQKRFRGVTLNVPEALPEVPVEVDPTQMRQLLYNLFNNAADATMNCPERRIDVTLVADDSQRMLHLTIADTGSGFEPDKLAKAFKEQFTTKENGHGFGLVVCNRIVENHGGSIDVDSAPGKGTRITISLPLHQEALQPA